MLGLGVSGYGLAAGIVVIGLLTWRIDGLKDDVSERDQMIGAANERINGLNTKIEEAAALNADLIRSLDRVRAEAKRNEGIATRLNERLETATADASLWRRKYDLANRKPQVSAYFDTIVPLDALCLLPTPAGTGCEGTDEGTH